MNRFLHRGNRRYRPLKFLSAWLLFAALTPASGALGAPAKPNIILILADDIGYGDLSCYGAKLVQTPNLDRLAREGRRFTDAHSPASTCSPTRRALLTGVYSWRQPQGSAIMPGNAPLSIPPGTVTLPSMLKQVGYTTGIVGKWHLGLGGQGGPDWNGTIKPGPLEIGFDYAFFFPATGDRVPCVFIENHNVVGLDPKDPIAVSYAGKIGNEPTGRENPELLKLKATVGHDRTIVNGIGRIGWMTGGKAARWKDEEIADTFTKRALGFIEKSKDNPFFLYFATHNIHVPRVPSPRFHDKSQCGTRGDAIAELDSAVGEVLTLLERLKLADNTLVIFSSDNGGVMDDGYEDVGSFKHPCNGKLRGYKGSLWEGGHRVPMIARWPGHISAKSECDELVTLLDLTATLASLTGQTLPKGAAADSINVLPALLGLPHEQPARETFVPHVGGIKGPFALRQGTWKLVQAQGKNPPVPFLVNLASDPGEKTNLASEQPQRLAAMTSLLGQITGSSSQTSRPKEEAKRKPNILHIHADDHRPDGLHALGNSLLQTPNLDTLVERGMTFNHCYTQGAMVGAVCLPSRTMMLTGRSWLRIEQQRPPKTPDDHRTPSDYLPKVISAAGYETWHMGKSGNEFKNGIESFDTNIVEDGRGDDRRLSSQRLADGAVNFLKQRKTDRPFYMYLAPPVPHDPRITTPEFANLYKAEDVKLSAAFMPMHPWDNGDMMIRDEQLAPWPRTPENAKQQIADYYACITGLDYHVGRILAQLKESGELENTIVIFTGDNGLSLGEHGLFGKQNLYEFGGMHVPLVIAGPGIPKGKSEALVYLMDLFPTFCDFAGAKIPAAVESKSLVPVILSQTNRVRDALYTGYKDCQRSVRTDRWKLIRYPLVDKTQLFDLRADPLELNNLAYDSKYATQLREMTALLEKEMARYGDTAPLKVPNPKPAEWKPPQPRKKS